MFKTSIIGNLTADPVSKTIGKSPAAEFCVAARTARKGADGQYLTNFVNVTVYGPQVDFITTNAKKGSKVFVDGSFSVVPYTNKEGKQAQSLNLVAASFELMYTPRGDAPVQRKNQASAMPDYDAQNPADPF